MSDVDSIEVDDELGVARVRRVARARAAEAGLVAEDAEAVVLAASELATNLLRYASRGRIRLLTVQRGIASGVELESIDDGPGIADLDSALRDSYSTGGGLGGGLPGVRRLMDEFEIHSDEAGTIVRARKWRKA